MASNAEKKDIENKLRKYPPVLTVKEVCEILHFGTTKVYGMIGTRRDQAYRTQRSAYQGAESGRN